MQITLCKEPFEYIIIDDTYTEDELKLIFLELDFWSLSGNLLPPDLTGSAICNDGKLKKKNKGVFLDEAYADRNYSNILKLNRKLYSLQLKEPSVINNFIKHSNYDTTLVSYYENSEYYTPHEDISILTALTYLFKKPKAFEGGDLIFTEYGIAFEPRFNRTYIILGAVTHEVTEVKMKLEDCKKGLGRYCISNFISRDRDRD